MECDIKPENLSADEDVKKIERRLKSESTKQLKTIKLLLNDK